MINIGKHEHKRALDVKTKPVKTKRTPRSFFSSSFRPALMKSGIPSS